MIMKKIINNPDQFVDEMVEGILLAHPDQVRTPGDDRRVLVRAASPAPCRPPPPPRPTCPN